MEAAIISKIAEQIPALVVLVWLVSAFIKAIRERDKEFQEQIQRQEESSMKTIERISNNHNQVMAQSNQLHIANTAALTSLTEQIRQMEKQVCNPNMGGQPLHMYNPTVQPDGNNPNKN